MPRLEKIEIASSQLMDPYDPLHLCSSADKPVFAADEDIAWFEIAVAEYAALGVLEPAYILHFLTDAEEASPSCTFPILRSQVCFHSSLQYVL